MKWRQWEQYSMLCMSQWWISTFSFLVSSLIYRKQTPMILIEGASSCIPCNGLCVVCLQETQSCFSLEVFCSESSAPNWIPTNYHGERPYLFFIFFSLVWRHQGLKIYAPPPAGEKKMVFPIDKHQHCLSGKGRGQEDLHNIEANPYKSILGPYLSQLSHDFRFLKDIKDAGF